MAKRLKKRNVGKSRCSTIKAGRRAFKVCVTAAPYGYQGWLVSKTGSRLPVPTGRARTLKSALSNARKFIRKVARR